MKLKYMALFGHLSALLLALVIIKETAAGVFEYLMETLGGFLSSSSAEASSALFTLPASLFLLLIFILFVILVCQAPALVGTKMVMDRDK